MILAINLEPHQYLNIFLTLGYIIYSIIIFREPVKHNPYKNIRTLISLSLAVCFMLLIAPKERPWILPVCAVGAVLLFLSFYLDYKDMKYSVARTVDSYKRHKAREHKGK